MYINRPVAYGEAPFPLMRENSKEIGLRPEKNPESTEAAWFTEK
jgi:hypothetical protein